MAHAVYTVSGLNKALEKMRDFLVANDWTVLNNCTADYTPDASGTKDGGKILAVKKGDIIVVMRTAMGRAVFEEQINHTPGSDHSGAYGIALTSCTQYTANPSSGYWYDQVNAPVNTAQKVIGVGIPAILGKNGTYKLHCNMITSPAVCVVFTLQATLNNNYTSNEKWDVYQHLAFGEVQKVGSWDGGTFISGSRSSYNMFLSSAAATSNNPTELDNGSNILFGMSSSASTLVRIDVDSAPVLTKPILWASSGADSGNQMSTGKTLGTMITNHNYLNNVPKYPHYGYIQSQNSNDYGRNVNTLNCISVNLPIGLFIERDPNSLKNYSQIGYIPGVYAISMRNVAPGKMYEINYPKSGNLHQVFPHSLRGGYHGYDGISILQEVVDTSTTN